MLTEIDKMYCDSYLEHGNTKAVMEKYNVSNTTVNKHLKKPESKDYISMKQDEHSNAIRADEIRRGMKPEGKSIEKLKTPEGLLAEAIRMYNSVPDPDFFKETVQEQLLEVIEGNVKNDKVDMPKLAEAVLKKIKSDVKINLDITSRQSSLYQNVFKYHKDFEEKKDEVFQELLLMGKASLRARAENNWKQIKAMTNDEY